MYERAKALVRIRRARSYVVEKRGRLRIENDIVSLNDERVVRRNEVRHAYGLYDRGRTLVRLTRSRAFGGDIEIDVNDLADADRLIGALRLDGASSVGEYTLTNGGLRASRKLLAEKALGVLVFLGIVELLLFAVTPQGNAATVHVVAPAAYFMATIGFVVATASRAVHASVGTDGVRLRRLSGTRFIPFAEVTGVKLNGREIQLELIDRSVVHVHYAREHRYEAEMLVERIEGQRSAQRVRSSISAPPSIDYLARRGRTPEEWLRAAETRPVCRAAFRTPVVPRERLWEIVEDASAPATARMGAALALRQDLREDASARMRLRVVAEACADPRMRRALEAVPTHESAVLRALEPLEDIQARW